MRGLVRTILTTNFDTCLTDALKERQPHIRQIHEINRSPGDDAEFDVFSKCQVVWLHGRTEQYSDQNSAGEGCGSVSSWARAMLTLCRSMSAGNSAAGMSMSTPW